MRKFKVISISLILIAGLLSCGDDSELLSKILINQPILEWGDSMDEIASQMQKYNLINKDDQNLYYAGNGMEHALSYNFVNGQLETSLVIVKADAITQDALEKLLKSYTFIGDQNNVKIYCNESSNTMAAVSTRQVNGVGYYYIGYSRID